MNTTTKVYEIWQVCPLTGSAYRHSVLAEKDRAESECEALNKKAKNMPVSWHYRVYEKTQQ